MYQARLTTRLLFTPLLFHLLPLDTVNEPSNLSVSPRVSSRETSFYFHTGEATRSDIPREPITFERFNNSAMVTAISLIFRDRSYAIVPKSALNGSRSTVGYSISFRISKEPRS